MINKNKKLAILTLIMWGFFICPPSVLAADQDIVISEIAAYLPGDHEWLEIYNKGIEPVDLTGWKFFEENTKHQLNAFQGDLIIESQEYAIISDVAANFLLDNPDFTGTIIDSSWTTLKEEGEEIGLINSAGENLETFTYLPCLGTSLQRINLELNDYTETNWQIHPDSHSAGLPNEFNAPADVNNEPGDTTDPDPNEPDPGNDDDNPEPDIEPEPEPLIIEPFSVLVNEFVSDPLSGQPEWIELYNKNGETIDLTDWLIIDGSGAETVLVGSITARGFWVIDNPKGYLNNSGDQILLKDNLGNLIDSVNYGNWQNGAVNAPAAPDPLATARKVDGQNSGNNLADFSLTETPTKGLANLITLTIPEEEQDNNENQAEPDDQKIVIEEKKLTYKEMISINEIFPNPIGADLHYEFIELKNICNQTVDLNGWQIQDADKTTYKITTADFGSTTILAGQYFVIERRISGIALNNDKDTVKLIAPDDKTVQTVKYQEAADLTTNASYALSSDDEWLWTETVTKGQENIIKILNHQPIIKVNCPKTALVNEVVTCDGSDSYDQENDDLTFSWEIGDKIFPDPLVEFSFIEKGEQITQLTVSDGRLSSKTTVKIKISEAKDTESKNFVATTKATTKKSTTSKTTKAAADNSITEITLEDIRRLELGTKVKTRGQVSVLPNILGKQIMYLAGSGIQLYMYKADWPQLSIGELVEVSGELAESKGETRIKLASKESFVILEKQDPPEPYEISISKIGEITEGYLVQIQGQLIEKSNSKFYLKDETGEAEINIKTNTKINKALFTEGDELKVIGIVSQTNELYQVLPRSPEDISKIENIVEENEPLVMVQNTKNKQVLQYLIPTAVFLALSLVIVLYTKKKNKN